LKPLKKSNQNFLAAYVFMVGLPLLGILGVLESGRKLAAPATLSGSWTLTVSASEAPAGCADWLDASHHSPMEISQSGRYLTLVLGRDAKRSASAILDGTLLATEPASSPTPTNSADHSGACAGSDVFSMQATIGPKTEPRGMSGVLTLDGCATCAPVKFNAVHLNSTPARSE
jgi:hypothetical protein